MTSCHTVIPDAPCATVRASPCLLRSRCQDRTKYARDKFEATTPVRGTRRGTVEGGACSTLMLVPPQVNERGKGKGREGEAWTAV